jgi:mevalonate kinase
VRDIEVFIPGKIMLAGEYAVLRGGHSLAVTVDIGMNVKLSWIPTAAAWTINSNLWEKPKIVDDDHTPQKDILCRAVQFAAKKTGLHGGTISITSALDVKHGLGSSSALRLGVCGAFFALQQAEKHGFAQSIPRESLNAAWQLQSEAQGLASGYDVVTQYVGGLVEFNFDYSDNKWVPHWFKHHRDGLDSFVHVYVGGCGAPTTQTVQTTASWLDFGSRLDKFLDVSETLIDAFNLCIQQPNTTSLKALIAACAASRAQFAGSPHFPGNIAANLGLLPGIDKKWTWKTTGAGGEDAILLIGEQHETVAAAARLTELGWHRLNVKFSDMGGHILQPPLTSDSTVLAQTSKEGPQLGKRSNATTNEANL